MRKISAIAMSVVLLCVISCSAPKVELVEESQVEVEQVAEPEESELDTAPEPEANLATGAEDIAGMWTRDLEGSVTSFYFKNDGTFSLSPTTDPEQLENSPGLIGEYWFDDSHLNLKDVEQFRALSIGMCPDVGIYEVIMLETGNLLFRVIDDECAARVDIFVGPGFIDLEFKPLNP